MRDDVTREAIAGGSTASIFQLADGSQRGSPAPTAEGSNLAISDRRQLDFDRDVSGRRS